MKAAVSMFFLLLAGCDGLPECEKYSDEPAKFSHFVHIRINGNLHLIPQYRRECLKYKEQTKNGELDNDHISR